MFDPDAPFSEIEELIGATASRICFDVMLEIAFETRTGSATLQVEQALRYESAGRAHDLVPEFAQARLGVLTEQYGQRVSSATATPAGHLDLVFGTDSRLKVAPHPDFEAWTLVTSSGLRLVAAPGHGLVVWLPEGSPPSSNDSPSH